ncbi:MAG: RNA polymerase sigma factor [Gemmatimonadales bacterium]
MRPNDLERELERHHRAARGWALSCCAWDETTAQDVLQASYLKILDGRAKFAGRSSFKTWLFGVIRRTAAEHRRRKLVRRFVPLSRLDALPEGPAGEADPETVTARSDESRRLIAALLRLPRRQRELLHLVFYQDLSISEAAAALGVSIGTARTHYERGKRRLRELLREENA